MIELVDRHNVDLKAIVAALGGAGIGSSVLDRGVVSGSVEIDFSDATIQRITLGGNVTLTFTGFTEGNSYFLVVDQGAGSYTVALTDVRFAEDSPYTASEADGARDILTFIALGFDDDALYCSGLRAFS